MAIPAYTTAQVREIRKQAAHYLNNHDVACFAGLTNSELTEFVWGKFAPAPENLHALAVRIQYYPRSVVFNRGGEVYAS